MSVALGSLGPPSALAPLTGALEVILAEIVACLGVAP